MEEEEERYTRYPWIDPNPDLGQEPEPKPKPKFKLKPEPERAASILMVRPNSKLC